MVALYCINYFERCFCYFVHSDVHEGVKAASALHEMVPPSGRMMALQDNLHSSVSQFHDTLIVHTVCITYV